ncbi:hypothetical protein POJ06DRAFT_240083 [Lipomyces tetrasporus]|uniref:RRM domain-containing protein n=1 Tax=Lipomyces tetrasporus TaxID=54092 RepID=A0AAD7QN79_9ASCO|nr:uncharacterized protein POJ06DRAFT_240083 [Lipomyces tetrasporus]KAJ8098374.1 hypothetical protein POJ06DRAFT_240083 [Lipomyces tetrasporus]
MSGKRKSTARSSYSKKPRQDASSTAAPPQKKNTAVYITNLPRDITFDELESIVGKYGLIAEDISTGKKRIKIYTDDDGTAKGDALVVFFRAESVALAVDMLDETKIRFDGKKTVDGLQVDIENPVIRVQPADMDYKVEKETQPIQQRTAREKREILKSVQRLNNKLADWDDDEAEAQQRAAANKRWSKIVILKHVFTVQELADDVAAALDIKEDIREGCEEIGPVSNVVLYDLEPDGVISIKFKDEDDALECVSKMDGRYFSGRQLKASIYDGQVRYRKSGKKHGEEEGNVEEERLAKFGEWLEHEEGDD